MDGRRYRILYEDEWLIVVDKVSGLLVIPTPKKESDTLTSLLNSELDRRGVEANAYPCHRLDRETSGLVVYAKGKKSQQILMEQFKNREVKKRYTAIVQGSVIKDLGILNSGIYNRNKSRQEPAITKYRTLERFGGVSVLDVEPITGRTNQIRIHLQRLGHPIVGESVYAFRKDFKLKFKRVALHAAGIEFKHPSSGKELKFISPLPQDMGKFIILRQNTTERA